MCGQREKQTWSVREGKEGFLSSKIGAINASAEQELQVLSHVRGFASHVSHQQWTVMAKSVRSGGRLSVPNEAEAERLPGISLVNSNSQVRRPPPQNIFDCNQCKLRHNRVHNILAWQTVRS